MNKLYTLQCSDYPIYGSFCNKNLNHFYLPINFSSKQCKKKIKLVFDISVFDNWNQEIFLLSIDNIPDDEDEQPQKVSIIFKELIKESSR